MLPFCPLPLLLLCATPAGTGPAAARILHQAAAGAQSQADAVTNPTSAPNAGAAGGAAGTGAATQAGAGAGSAASTPPSGGTAEAAGQAGAAVTSPSPSPSSSPSPAPAAGEARLLPRLCLGTTCASNWQALHVEQCDHKSQPIVILAATSALRLALACIASSAFGWGAQLLCRSPSGVIHAVLLLLFLFRCQC